ESLGLGFCFIGSIRNSLQEVIELLELPRLSFPLCGMTLGWPVSPPLVRPRLPLETVLHWETYAVSGEERYLRQYDRAMIETGIYEGRQVSSADGEDDEENYGWMGHSARRVSQIIRPHLREVLRQAGFGLR
ncbi:MAG: NADPH-dependent oxidoreductase, partial [Chloroflexota bacterium]